MLLFVFPYKDCIVYRTDVHDCIQPFFTFVLYHVTEVVKTIVFTSVLGRLQSFFTFYINNTQRFYCFIYFIQSYNKGNALSGSEFCKKYKTFVSLMYHTFYL